MLTIRVNTTEATKAIVGIARKQIPFALKNAITTTGLSVQAAQRKHDTEVFTVRQAKWLYMTVKVTKFPTKSNPSMTIAIEPPGATGKARADILGKFETDTSKVSSKEGGHVAIPIRARRNKRDIIIGSSRPKAFNFKRIGKAIRGDKRTFIVTTKKGDQLILQRAENKTKGRKVQGPALPQGFRMRDARGRYIHIAGERRTTSAWALYYLAKRTRLTPNLHFEQNANQVVPKVFPPAFEQAFADAMKTAR